MTRATSLRRRAELVEQTRRPAPPGYNYSPTNRAQRRLLARTLRQARKQTSGR